MSESTDNATEGRGRALAWGTLAVVLLVAATAEVVGRMATAAPGAPASLTDQLSKGEPDSTPRNVYGLTASDVSLLAAAVDQSGGRAVVAGYPGRSRLNGPLLTRLDEPTTRLPRGERPHVVVKSVGGGWSQLSFPKAQGAGRRPTLAGAEVTVEPTGDADGERRACTRLSLEQFRCADHGWATVEWRSVTIQGNGARCIWVHPLEKRRIVVDFGRVSPVDGDGRYTVEAALADHVATERGEVDLTIGLGDRTITHTHPNQKGWTRKKLPNLTNPERLTVGVSAERVGRRHFCFRLTPR